MKEMEESAVSLIALKRMHFKEACANYEEAQRLQRMCRYLKVNYIDYIILNSNISNIYAHSFKNKKSLTQVIQNAYYKMREDYEKLKLLEAPNALDECYDVSEQAIEGNVT